MGADMCAKLEAKDQLEAIDQVMDAMDPPRLIPKGAACSFIRNDSDGDHILWWDDERRIGFKHDLDAFSLR